MRGVDHIVLLRNRKRGRGLCRAEYKHDRCAQELETCLHALLPSCVVAVSAGLTMLRRRVVRFMLLTLLLLLPHRYHRHHAGLLAMRTEKNSRQTHDVRKSSPVLGQG